MSNKALLKAVLVFALITFLMPFATVSCETQKLKTFSGLELSTGTVIKNVTTGQDQYQLPEITVTLAFVALAAAAYLAFKSKQESSQLAAILSFVASGLLVVAFFRINGIVSEKQLKVSYEIGYYLCLISSAAAGGLAISSKEVSELIGKTSSANTSSNVCPHCGAEIQLNISYCTQCHAKVK